MVSRMRGHSDTVTGMKLSPDGSYLLTNAMDSTCKWHQGRCLAIVEGAHLLETCVSSFSDTSDGWEEKEEQFKHPNLKTKSGVHF